MKRNVSEAKRTNLLLSKFDRRQSELGNYLKIAKVSAGVKINQMISKHGTIDMDTVSDATINQITADDGLKLTQKAQNLTIRNIGTDSSKDSATFNDILYPHDDIATGAKDGVSVDTIYANNAYINTSATNFKVKDGIISNYAEFRSKDKLGIVDNDFRRLLTNADIQLYTAKTGSFGLDFDRTINMRTTAPTVYNNPHMLVNEYHSEWNFVNLGQKEQKYRLENAKMPYNMDKNKYNEPIKPAAMRFDTTNDTGLYSDTKIYYISTTDALIKNDKKLKPGQKTTIVLKFDDVDISVNAKVIYVNDDKADVEFIDMPKDVTSKILYRYMQSNLTISYKREK